MSGTKNLTKTYGRFFLGCVDFAIFPYTGLFEAVARNDQGQYTDILPAALVVGILTFAIPLLPALFSVTSALASVAMSLAIASMFILYPMALVDDFCGACAANPRQSAFSY